MAPRCFACKRCLVIVFALLTFLYYLLATLLVVFFNFMYDNVAELNVGSSENVLLCIGIVTSLTATIFALIGIVGAWRDNCCLTSCYCLFCFFLVLIQLLYAIIGEDLVQLLHELLPIINVIASIVYLRDLKTVRRELLAEELKQKCAG